MALSPCLNARLSSALAELMRAALCEIWKAVEETVSESRVEITRRQRENEALRRRLQELMVAGEAAVCHWSSGADGPPVQSRGAGRREGETGAAADGAVETSALPDSGERAPIEQQHCEQEWSSSLRQDTEPTDTEDNQGLTEQNRNEEELRGLESGHRAEPQTEGSTQGLGALGSECGPIAAGAELDSTSAQCEPSVAFDHIKTESFEFELGIPTPVNQGLENITGGLCKLEPELPVEGLCEPQSATVKKELIEGSDSAGKGICIPNSSSPAFHHQRQFTTDNSSPATVPQQPFSIERQQTTAEITRLKTERGNDKIECNGYYYNKDRILLSDPTVSTWFCDQKSKFKCNGRVYIQDDQVKRFLGEHNHGPDPAKKTALTALQAVRERAGRTQETTEQIIASVSSDIQPASATKMPSKSALKRTIQRHRNRQNRVPLPPQPANLNSLHIDADRCVLPNGKQFLRFDTGPADDRIIIFATNENLALLSQCTKWYAYGTVMSAPNLFEQVYTIHGKVMDTKVVPLVYALLPNNTHSSYQRMLQAIVDLQPCLRPDVLMTDFEQAAIRAFCEAFPTMNAAGCFFHLCQAIWRRVQALGLQADYQGDLEFAVWIKCLPALALIPPGDVEEAFELLISDNHFDHRAIPVANYFEDTYIGRRRVGSRQIPKFPVLFWNVHESTLNDNERTNNQVEAFHRRFQSLVGAQVNNIFRFIDVLQQQQMKLDNEIEKLICGEEPAPRKRKYQDLDAQIKNILRNRGTRTHIQTLREIAYCFEF